MNTSMLDFIKQQKELKDRIMPKGIYNVLELKKRLQPLQAATEKLNAYRNVFPKNFVEGWQRQKEMTEAIVNPGVKHFLASKKHIGVLSEYSKMNRIANAASSFNRYLPLKDIGIAAAGIIETKSKIPKSLIDIVIERSNSPINGINNRFVAAAAMNPLNNMVSPLGAINTSILSESMTTLLNNPFARYFKSFAIPDFDELEEGEELGEESKRIILINHGDIPRIIKEICDDNSRLYTVPPRTFEKIIAELFSFHGYKARLTKQTRDGGFDIIVEKMINNGIPFKALIECKRNRETNKVDVQIIRAFSAVACSFGVNNAIVVTTSGFTKDAWVESKYMPADMSLRQKKDIIRWSESYTGKTPPDNLMFSEKRTDRGIILSA